LSRPWRQQVELVLSLAKRDLKTRYKESVLGFFWSLARPLFMTVIIWAVFSKILAIEFPYLNVPYWAHVLVSLLAWNYFVGALFEATHSVVANANLLKKVRLDAEVFPLAAVLANLAHFVMAMAVVLAVLPLAGVRISGLAVLLPVIIGLETLLIIGCALYLSALNVFYRDVASALEIVTMGWFYVTPIVYSGEMAWNRLQGVFGPARGLLAFDIYMLNPVAPIVVAIRKVVLYGLGLGEMHRHQLYGFLAVSAVVSLLLTASGWYVFRRLSQRFVDEL
jgi:ABC-type polysaccharide/polyol phosphate export permease